MTTGNSYIPLVSPKRLKEHFKGQKRHGSIPRGLDEFHRVVAGIASVAVDTLVFDSGLFGDPRAAALIFAQRREDARSVAALREKWVAQLRMDDGLNASEAEQITDDMLKEMGLEHCPELL